MHIEMTKNGENEFQLSESMVVYADDGEAMSSAGFTTLYSRYGHTYLKTLAVGGISTLPQYRRNGCVREMFNKAFAMAPEREWAVSLLHPFSFSYYRKFGYEKISDHKIVSFPMKALECFPRCSELIPLNGKERLQDVLDIFERFTDNRNIMFRRYNAHRYNTEPSGGDTTYIWYDRKGVPASYITVGIENYCHINHMVGVNLNVMEMAFTSRESLAALFGFMRMYEGELDSVKIHNCAMSPEIDFMLKHYMHTTYALVPDIMGRILNVETVLKANPYPAESGHFRLMVEDTLPFTRGGYEVEYGHGDVSVRRIDDTAQFDIIAAMPALTQLLYGYEAYTSENAVYLDGVSLHGSATAFFRAFPKKNNGLFEHF